MTPRRIGSLIGDLALTLTMSDAVPGDFARLGAKAAAPGAEPAWAETVTYSRTYGEEP